MVNLKRTNGQTMIEKYYIKIKDCAKQTPLKTGWIEILQQWRD